LNFVRKGRVKPRTVVRGPTTHQLWRFAAHVKGLSREFGLCYSCGGKIEASSTVCPQCNRLQLPPLNPDALLETGEAESPPGSAPMTGAAAGAVSAVGAMAANGVGYGEAPESPPEASAEEENHDIVVPALTDGPAESMGAPATPQVSETSNSAESVSEPAGAAADAEVAGVASAAMQSMSLVGMSAAPDAPLGARARSLALKASGGIGNVAGPRIVPLAAPGNSPAPLLTTDAPPVSFRGERGRWRGAAEIALFLLVLVGALGGGLLLADPSLREWVQTTYNHVLKGMHLKSDADEPMPNLNASDAPDQVPAGSPTFQPLPKPSPSADTSNPKPAVVPTPMPAPAPLPPVAHTDQPSADIHPASPAPTDGGQGDKPATSDADREEALYRAALDAESAGNFAAAVKDYKQIMLLPKSVWRTDVEQRLHYDEGLLGSER
jgi:hypothetical protein